MLRLPNRLVDWGGCEVAAAPPKRPPPVCGWDVDPKPAPWGWEALVEEPKRPALCWPWLVAFPLQVR